MAQFPDDWQNFYNTGLSQAWANLVAYAFTNLSYVADVAANNTYLETAIDREAVINICKLIGYQLRPTTSASVTCTATLTSVLGSDVSIPAGTQVQSSNNVTFNVLEDQTIPAGSISAEVVLTEGTLNSDSFSSNGLTFQTFQLTESDAVKDSITITVDGVPYTQVNSLVYASSTEESYSVSYSIDDRAILMFGDNITGAIPPIGVGNIVVNYRVASGVLGNVALREIDNAVTGYIVGGGGSTTPVDLLNDNETGSGGEPRETMAHAKLFAPQWVSANGRAVTEYDFDVLATQFVDSTYGSAAFVKARLKQEVPELNTVIVALWSRDSAGDVVEPASGLLQAMETYFNNDGEGSVRTICTLVECEAGEIIYVDVQAIVNVSSSYAVAQVVEDVKTAIDGVFSDESNFPGQDVRLSEIYTAIQGVTGVNNSLVENMTASYKTTEGLGAGTDTDTYVFTLDGPSEDFPITPSTVLIETSGGLVVSDDGLGGLIGDINSGGANTINYDTGAVAIVFSSIVPSTDIINSSIKILTQKSRLDSLATLDGTTDRMYGVLNFPPLTAYSISQGIYGIAFSDGRQTVIDKFGDGKLYQESYGAWTESGTINYDTGSYDFTFSTTPQVDSNFVATYVQKLSVASEDIPIEKSQLAVVGNIVVTASETV